MSASEPPASEPSQTEPPQTEQPAGSRASGDAALRLSRRACLAGGAAALAGAAAALLPPTWLGADPLSRWRPAPAAGRAPAEPPVLRDLAALLPEPVVVRRVDVVQVERGARWVRVTDAAGRIGAVPANDQLAHLLPILRDLVVPAFVGQDARAVERLVDDVYAAGRNYKYAGMPFWNCVAHVELACLDLLGRLAALPVGRLVAGAEEGVRRPRIPVYVTRLTRETTPEREVAAVAEALARTGCRAVKVKVGGRMGRDDLLPGRTARLIPLLRRTLGDGVTLYADANGSYADPDAAIAVGRLLEAHGVAVWEEPCPWQDYEGTKRVADALALTVAGGEQESSAWQWGWMARTRVLDCLQPDLYYNGGFVRALRVARLAAAHGLGVAPHTPKALPAAAPLLHFASVVPNLVGFQEYRAEAPELVDGEVAVPTGPGLGTGHDAAHWARATPV